MWLTGKETFPTFSCCPQSQHQIQVGMPKEFSSSHLCCHHMPRTQLTHLFILSCKMLNMCKFEPPTFVLCYTLRRLKYSSHIYGILQRMMHRKQASWVYVISQWQVVVFCKASNLDMASVCVVVGRFWYPS